MPKGTEITSPGKAPVLAARRPRGGLQPTDFDQMWRMAQVMAASGMMPRDLSRPEQVFVAIQAGLEIGLSPMQAVQNICVINGRPTLWGDAALALVMASGKLEWIDETPPDEAARSGCAVCRLKRVHHPEISRTFTLDDAKRAKLFGKSGPWQEYPGRMLQMRARSLALRDMFPDILKGVGIREEVIDIDTSEQTPQPLDSLRQRLAAIQSQPAEPQTEAPDTRDDCQPPDPSPDREAQQGLFEEPSALPQKQP